MNQLEHSTAAEAAVEMPTEVKAASPSTSTGPSLGAVALAGVGALALGAVASSPARAISPQLRFATDIPGTGDTKVLNYALALEDLETELYVQAIQRMTTGGRGGRDAVPGLTIPGLNLSTSLREVRFTTEFGRVERQHRDLLRQTLGSAAIPASTFDFTFGIERMSLNQLLNLLYTIEQGGTNAYIGAIPFFATKRPIPVAAAIQGTEARHTAIFADILNDRGLSNDFPSPPPNALPPGIANLPGTRERPLEPDQILAVVSPFIVRPTA